jgi:hypothetical protein
MADFPADAGVILTDVLGCPPGDLAVQAHEARQIGLSQEADLGRFLGFDCRFVLAARDCRGDSPWAGGFDNSQNQRPAVGDVKRRLHSASAHDKHSARSLTFCASGPGPGCRPDHANNTAPVK